MELIPTTLAHGDVQPQHTGVHKSTFLNPSELSALPDLSACGWCGRLGWGCRGWGLQGLGAAGASSWQTVAGAAGSS